MRHATAGSIALAFALTVLATGCHGDSMTSAQLTQSPTAAMPGLVKLVPRSASNAAVVLDVVIYGPEQGLDLSGFAFGVAVGDPTLARFVSESSYVQTALLPGAGQSVLLDVDGTSNPSLVQVHITEQGGGVGNGIAGASAIVIELAFQVQRAGATTLTLVGLDGSPAHAINSTGGAIGAVTFDGASAGIQGVTTGGGGY